MEVSESDDAIRCGLCNSRIDAKDTRCPFCGYPNSHWIGSDDEHPGED